MEASQRRKAENEALFREVNERIESLQLKLHSARDDSLNIVCECHRGECTDQVSVAIEAYERVRQDSRSFFVMPGHQDPEVEDVVDRTDTYLVVRKHPGEPARVAVETDSRTGS